MPLFDASSSSLKPIKESSFDLEKHIQQVTEDNLIAIFGLQFVCTELALNNLRIDTLAFDNETRSFVIIEYKRDKSFSVIDQGYAYLSLMLNNKADFILEYNERTGQSLGKGDVDWSQSRVIFIANSFTAYQQQAINFKDLPIELWEVKKYSNQSILYNQLKSPDSSESIKTVSKNKQIQNVSKEVQKYSVDDLFKPDMQEVREVFESLREKILGLDSAIIESPQKHYVGYKLGWKILVAINVQRTRLMVDITRTKPDQLNDPGKKANLVKDSMKNYGQYISRLEINNLTDAEYVFGLIQQAYTRQYK